MDGTSKKKVVTFGELLLSLCAKGNERIVQAGEFVARYTGAEANVAVSLVNFGFAAFAVSRVPPHEVGQACINYLRRFGVNTDFIVRGGDRLGLLYLETGAGQRPSKVIYDRSHSSLCGARREDFDWDAVLSGKDWFHFSGTAPALGESIRHVLLDALRAARRLGLQVSCDCNYRGRLWSAEEAGRILSDLMPHVNVFVCGEEDPGKIFGIRPGGEGASMESRCDETGELLRRRFGLDAVAVTLRVGVSASVNRLSALLLRGGSCFKSREYEIQIVDRVGGGDAFAAGLIKGILSGYEDQHIVEFATAASCLKHSIPGDFNLVSSEEVEELLAGNQSGRIQR